MNAPTPISDFVSVLLPACTDEHERALRCELLMARDVASHQIGMWRFTSPEACDISRALLSVSAEYAFAGEPAVRLQQAVEVCRHLLGASALLEILEGSTHDAAAA